MNSRIYFKIGLFLGASLMTVLELVDFSATVLVILSKRVLSNKSKVSQYDK